MQQNGQMTCHVNEYFWESKNSEQSSKLFTSNNLEKIEKGSDKKSCLTGFKIIAIYCIYFVKC